MYGGQKGTLFPGMVVVSGGGGGEQSSHLSWNPHQIPAPISVRLAVLSVSDLLLQMKTELNWT